MNTITKVVKEAELITKLQSAAQDASMISGAIQYGIFWNVPYSEIIAMVKQQATDNRKMVESIIGKSLTEEILNS